jgi:hypothetical protein
MLIGSFCSDKEDFAMTDLGFGLADRRNVVVIIVTILLSHVLFDNPIPIEMTSTLGFITSYFLLIGFIYLSRIVFRVLLVLCYFVLRIPFNMYDSARNMDDNSNNKVILSNVITYGISEAFTRGVLLPLFYDKDWKWMYLQYDSGVSGRVLMMIGVNKERITDLGILGVFDRMFLISIVFISSYSQTLVLRNTIGPIGLYHPSCLL